MNLSKAFSLYNITRVSKTLPLNPYQLSKRKLKKTYELEVLEYNNEYLKIEFIPRNLNENYYSGVIWLDSSDYSLLKLEIVGGNKKNLFVPIGITEVEELNYKISYNYSKRQGNYKLSHISINYHSNIHNEISREINTEAILYITQYNESFYSPHFKFQHGISDYRALSIVPDTIIFNCLSKDGNFLLSKEQQYNLKTLKEEGEGFNSSDFGKELFENNYVIWSKDRISMKKTKKTIKINGVKNIDYQIDRYGFKSDMLEINTDIYFDLEESSEGILVETSSIFDIYNSYNHLSEDLLFQAYVNIYFDLVEIYRLKFLGQLDVESMGREEINDVFKQIVAQLEDDQSLLRKDSFAGQDINKLKMWNDFVDNELGINNFELMNISTDLHIKIR